MIVQKGSGRTFFTSDLQLHFHHKNIVKFTKRGIDTTQELHDEWLTGKWNSQVKPGDLVYHLGDFSFAKTYDILAAKVRELNGTKIFLKGNHDDRKNFDRLVQDNLIAAWYDYKEIKIAGNSVVLFHFPIGSWHKQGHGSWHLHGHSHGNYNHSRGKMFDVGIDNAMNEFGSHTFLREGEIELLMQEREVFIADNHRENI